MKIQRTEIHQKNSSNHYSENNSNSDLKVKKVLFMDILDKLNK